MACGIQGGCQILRSAKWYKKLHLAKYRREEKMFLVEGFRAVQQVLESAPSSIDHIITSDPHLTVSAPCPVERVEEYFTDAISSDRTAQGTAALVRLPSGWDDEEVPSNPGSGILLLEDVQDPGNVGTLIRSAVAFGFSGILMSAQCADPFSPKAVHAAAGSMLSVWIRRTAGYLSTVSVLKQSGYCVVATDLSGTGDTRFSLESKIVLALGNEGNGISEALRETASSLYRIRMREDGVESLNVGAAGAVVMHTAARLDFRE